MAPLPLLSVSAWPSQRLFRAWISAGWLSAFVPPPPYRPARRPRQPVWGRALRPPPRAPLVAGELGIEPLRAMGRRRAPEVALCSSRGKKVRSAQIASLLWTPGAGSSRPPSTAQAPRSESSCPSPRLGPSGRLGLDLDLGLDRPPRPPVTPASARARSTSASRRDRSASAQWRSS